MHRSALAGLSCGELAGVGQDRASSSMSGTVQFQNSDFQRISGGPKSQWIVSSFVSAAASSSMSLGCAVNRACSHVCICGFHQESLGGTRSSQSAATSMGVAADVSVACGIVRANPTVFRQRLSKASFLDSNAH